MTNTVRVSFVGGGFDGCTVTYWSDGFSHWDGIHPHGWFRLDRQSFCYQATQPYHDGDSTVTMQLLATSYAVGPLDDDDDDDSGYDGWLAPCDRYDDREGQP